MSAPTAAWVVGRTRPGSRCSSTAGSPASRAAIGTAWVTTVSRWSRGSRRRAGWSSCRRRGGRWRRRAGSRSSAARAIRSFCSVLALVALGEAGLDHGQALGGHGAAVHPADQAHALERGEVAAHGLGGDVVLVGELGHRHAGRAAATSWAIACWRSSAYMVIGGLLLSAVNLCICCFTPECVDCQGRAGLTCDHGHHAPTSTRPPLLHGTPVVPGVAHGPALRRPRRGLARRRSRASATAASPTRRPRSRRTTPRPPPSPTASRARPTKASGAAAEVLTASAGLARDKGLRSRGAQEPARRRGPARRGARRPSSSSSRVFTAWAA